MGGVRRVAEWYKLLVEGYLMKVSYESIHRIKNPKVTEFIRFENEYPWI